MSCRSDGESEENQRPELIASRSSMVRMGSSMVCLMRDWCLTHCNVNDRAGTTGSVPWGTAWERRWKFDRLFVSRRLFRKESRNADAAVGVVQVLHHMIP